MASSPDGFSTRPATAHDVPALAALYAHCATQLGPAVYSAEQVAAWAGFGTDSAEFRAYVLDADTWVLQASGTTTPLGFCGVGGDAALGEVHSLYVHPDWTRQGLGTRLLKDALARARQRGTLRLAAWVTPLSRPLFLRQGFRLVDTVQAPYQGVMFERYRVSYP